MFPGRSLSLKLAGFYARQSPSMAAPVVPGLIGIAQAVLFFTGTIQDSFYVGMAIAFLLTSYFLYVIHGFQLLVSTEEKRSARQWNANGYSDNH